MIIISVLLIYFVGHALYGENQSIPLADLEQERRALTQQLDSLKAEQRNLQRKIYALRPETLDLDYVEEMARKRLYMLYPDEIMVVIEPVEKNMP